MPGQNLRREHRLWTPKISSPRDGDIHSGHYHNHWTHLQRGWCVWESWNNLEMCVPKKTNMQTDVLCTQRHKSTAPNKFFCLQLKIHQTQKAWGELICQDWCEVIVVLRESTQENWRPLLLSSQKATEVTFWGGQFQFCKIRQTLILQENSVRAHSELAAISC